MKKVLAYLSLFTLAAGSALAQGVGSSYKYSFQDSIRIVLENTKNIDAGTVGVGFSEVWISLGPDQQRTIRVHLKTMKKKLYKLRPQLVNYFGAIVDAINLEKTDPARLSKYLFVAGKVIDKESPAKANEFFKQSRDFFEAHALNNTKFYRLRVVDDDYRFDYIDPPVYTTLPDTTQTVAYVEPDTSSYNLPSYLQPIQQPELTGPVLRFDKLTLNFATPYDSTFLRNTKGIFSLRDKIFVGEGGRFDWSSTGLGGDSVYYEFSKFHFKTASASLKAGQGKLTYVGRLPGVVQGVFEFKSVSHKDEMSAGYPRFVDSELVVLKLHVRRPVGSS